MSDQLPADQNSQSAEQQGAPSTPPPGAAQPAPEHGEAAAKPDVGKRFIAYVIDAVIAGVLGYIPVIGSLLGAAYILTRDGFEFDFMDGRSVGKKIMKLRPVRDDGGKMDVTTSIKRNLSLAIGTLGGLVLYSPFLGAVALTLLLSFVGAIVALVEAYFVLTAPDGRRWGDRFAGTRVIETDA